MKESVKDSRAVQFGAWLKVKRRESGVVARVFASRIDLSPAEYAEVESGILHWIGGKQERKIPLMLRLNPDDEADFSHKLSLAREDRALTFGDVYSEEELSPARCSTVGGKRIDAATRQAIIKAVFTPLTRDARASAIPSVRQTRVGANRRSGIKPLSPNGAAAVSLISRG